MKIKITSIWIPITLGLVFVSVLSILKLLDVLDEGKIEWISFVLSTFLLLFYFPRLSYIVIKKGHPQKDDIINYIGLYSIVLWTLMFVTILLRLPVRMFCAFGALHFMFNYLPALYILKYRQSDKRRKLLYFNLCTFFALLMFYALAKTQMFPFHEFLGKLCIVWFCFLLIPNFCFLAFKKDLRFDFKTSFVFVFLFAYVISNVQDTRIRQKQFNNVSANQKMVEKNLRLNKNKTDFIYEAFLANRDADTTFIVLRDHALLLKRLSIQMNSYIHQVKTNIVAVADGIDQKQADTIKFEKIEQKSNYDVPTFVLFGNSDSLKKGPYSAFELRKKLTLYSDSIIQLLPIEAKVGFKQNNPLNITDSEKAIDGRLQTWEVDLFFHRPLGTIFTQLTNLQSDVKYAEMLVLNELFNKANSSRKDNVAAQLADLSAKYESEKKEKQIRLLEKDKELNASKLEAKDLAISQKEQTIIYFVLALIGFVVLVIFVIRANILRKKANQLLTEQKLEITRQKQEVESQKHLVEEKNKEISDSINYAKRLQEAILPPAEFIAKHLPDTFILYKPKDVVAGDFYWAESIGDKFYLAAADSTGHGVPGALVSVVCSNALNRTVKEFRETDTGKILDKTRELVQETFEKSVSEVKDGMDISLLCIDAKNKTVTWSGANNPLWYIQGQQLYEIKADKQPIGKTDYPKPFTTHTIAFKEGTTFYLFTDGFADQFGGPAGKKFKYKQFSDFLISIHQLTTTEQAGLIGRKFEEWKGELEQVDDVCVIGLKIKG